ncbi:unnamed protein product [Lactuca saligna]|uniref:Uncharacterized protein n=1 Tax=Lactuca saligna TaxID=75948 RepID=A0AA36E7X9_LACSI|nr:unnamed protein product [Lactuca saligna]
MKDHFPFTIKKLLPGCWKYLAHVFVSYISGRRSGPNEISLLNTGAIAALASGIEFNFSKFILHELILNIEGNKREKFLMYPMFLQIIFNVMHPEIERGNETLDLKSIDPNNDHSESENLSNPTETEDVVISISEPENKEVDVSPAAAVAEEHDHLHDIDVEGNFDREAGDEDFSGDDDFPKELDFTGISDDIPSSIELNLDDDEFGPLPGFDSRCFKKVNEVSQLATETGEDVSALKILLSASKPMEVSSGPTDVVSEIPPSGVSTVSQVPPVSSTVTTTTLSTPPIPSEEGPSTMYEPHGIVDPPVAPNQSTYDDFPVDPPPPRTTTVVNRFDREPENNRSHIRIKQGKRTVTASKSDGLLFMKNSNENHKAKDHVLTVTDLKKRKFGDEYGDRSGIQMWAFDPRLNMWVVNRNSGVPEYYKSVHDFNS